MSELTAAPLVPIVEAVPGGTAVPEALEVIAISLEIAMSELTLVLEVTSEPQVRAVLEVTTMAEFLALLELTAVPDITLMQTFTALLKVANILTSTSMSKKTFNGDWLGGSSLAE